MFPPAKFVTKPIRPLNLFNAIFNIETCKPFKTYYSFVAFNKLYQLKNQVKCVVDTENMYVLCAKDGDKIALAIVNLTGETQLLDISGLDLTNANFHLIDEDRTFTWIEKPPCIENNGVLLITIG